jgi:NAD(P)-dependent dehydrogenase (short-subunit alcohol dehydrogenase family)
MWPIFTRIVVVSPAGAVSVCDTALKAFARIDVLVNNTGVYDFLAFEDVDDAGWERLFTLNLMAAVHTHTRDAPPHSATPGCHSEPDLRAQRPATKTYSRLSSSNGSPAKPP